MSKTETTIFISTWIGRIVGAPRSAGSHPGGYKMEDDYGKAIGPTAPRHHGPKPT